MCFRLPPGEGALCSIPIENILAVERLEEESFKMKNVRTHTATPMKSFRLWAFGPNHSYRYMICCLTCCLFFPPSDVPGHSARAGALHPGQQLCWGARLDRHPDQSQPVQPQTPKHLPSFSLPQRPLALLQALGRHSPWVYALHWVRKAVEIYPASGSCVHSLILLCASVFSGLPANIQLDVDGDRETERIYSLFSTYMTKLIKMQGQTRVFFKCIFPVFTHVYFYIVPFVLCLTLLPVSPGRGLWQ